MLLKSIEVFEFKSIKHEILNISSRQLCIVGVNESGKSSLIEAVSYLNVYKEMAPGLLNKQSSRYPRGYPMICGVFEIEARDKDFAKLIHDYTKWGRGSQDFLKLNPLLQLKRWGNGLSNISITLHVPGVETVELLQDLVTDTKRAEFLDKFFRDHFPVIELFQEEDLLIEPATIDNLKGSDSRYETFRRLLYIGGCRNLDDIDVQNPNMYSTYILRIEKSLNKIFRKQYKQDDSISIRIITTSNGHLNLVIQDATDQSFTIHERSPGFQYYFSFVVNKLYYNEIYGAKSIVYLLDEPGSNLHPKGAKDLLKTFDDISTKNNIIYTTHNPFLAIRNSVDGLLFAQKSSSDGTRINKKPWLKKFQVVRKELGIVLNDSFLIGDMNLLVEGITEKYALHQVFQDEKYKHLEWINIYDTEGVTNVTQAVNYLSNSLDQSGIVLLDSDKAGDIEAERGSFIKAMASKKWDVVRVNDVFPGDKQERTFEDIFPHDIYIEAFNMYCRRISALGIFSKDYVDYAIPEKGIKSPIINSVSKHFYSFIDLDKHKENSISKQDVLRCLFEIVQGKKKEEQDAILDNIRKLAGLIDNKVKAIEKHVSHQT